ncbi:hypothetical protein AB1Y20_009840 [Prymnesium parvum]|uniref:Uncharacterized protein n=1 Tax=Prymnesium parvum TaxID=97485 RepID=A0AB34K5P9_PRYPA
MAMSGREVRDYYQALRCRRPPQGLWNLRLARLPIYARMERIRSPSLLVLGCHLAAIELQRFVRGYLIRILVSVVAVETHHHLITASKHAAIARAHFRSLRPKPATRNGLAITRMGSALAPNVIDVGLVARYLEAKVCGRIQSSKEHGPSFEVWALTRLQAWGRMLPWMRCLKMMRMATLKRAAISIQRGWAGMGPRRAARGAVANVEAVAARKIQRAWQGLTNRRIFMYFREMIEFREQGDPAELLRCINPREAKLIEPGASLHVRFRLGGSHFPPVIYYKVFSHGPVTDIGAFAPRDYTDHYQPPAIVLHNHLKPGQILKDLSHSGWYRRIENNGWRPVAGNNLQDLDTPASAAKPVPWHHSKLVRRQHLEEKRRQKKLHWMRTMYAQGRMQDEGTEEEALALKQLEKRMNGEISDEDVDALLDWSEQLDFDTYVSNWQSLATSTRAPIGSTPSTFNWESAARTA